LVSVEHVAVVVVLVQMPPSAVHGAAELHVHSDVPALVVHVWWVPQVPVVIHWLQPLDCVSHVWAVVLVEHCDEPSGVQAFVQHAADPALP
jgi:hypothetical protein